VRRVGDLCLAAFFAREKDKDREALRGTYQALVRDWQTGGHRDAIDAALSDLHGGDHPICPLHWEIEFPEVFRRNNPGFDAIVGNPPFAGKNTVAASHRATYPDWLKSLHAESHGAADLVAHFFRRAFTLLRDGGTLGLIATNTIAQGDTRSSGLRWICTHGGAIYHATRRYKWPGLAAVIVSVVHIQKGASPERKILDGREVPLINAFLFHTGSNEDPGALISNQGLCFLGTNVVGEGFKFDDTDVKQQTWPLSKMHELIRTDHRNQERIFPFIGGEELNDSPTHKPHRYIIDFGEMSEPEARRWPDLMSLIEEKVRPKRMMENREAYRRFWWRHGERRVELYRQLSTMKEVFACSQTSKYRLAARMNARMVFSTKAVVFAFSEWGGFSIIQSRIHELWALYFGSSMKDDPVYTPSDCFETFPFPPNWESDPRLEEAGRVYYEFRAALMVRNDEGLTKTYNRFHDPSERDPDILKLRALHADMDRAVLAAYGWTDIATDCDFYLDYEIDEASWGDKKKPYRYRFPDAVRDDLLARLLDLNQARYREEVGAGLHSKADGKGPAATRGAGKTARPRAAAAAAPTAATPTAASAAGSAAHPDAATPPAADSGPAPAPALRRPRGRPPAKPKPSASGTLSLFSPPKEDEP